MKQLILVVFVILAATPANAEEISRKDFEKLCAMYAETAGKTAESRYAGVPMHKAMEAAGEDEVLRHIVKKTYAKPDYVSTSFQARAKNELINDVFAECIESYEAQ